MTNAEKRELVKRLRFEAGVAKDNGLHHETIFAAADYIESTLPPPVSPGQELYEAVAEVLGWETPWHHRGHHRESQTRWEDAAKRLGLSPKEQP